MDRIHDQVVEDRVHLSLSDGKTMSIRRWSPTTPSRHTIIGVHGMMSHGGWFASLARSLARGGITFLAADRRGSGESRKLVGAFDIDLWLSDIRKTVELASRNRLPITLFCWCWGARTGTISAASGLPIDGLVLAAPAFVLDASVVKRFQEADTSGEEIPLPFDPVDDFSDDPSVREFISQDKLRLNSVSTGFLKPSGLVLERALSALPQIKVPILCILAKQDKLISNAETRALMSNNKVEEIPGGHAFVLERPDILTRILLEWIGNTKM